MWPPITTSSFGCCEPGISPMTSPLSASGSSCAPISRWIFTGTPSEYRRPIMSESSGDMAAAAKAYLGSMDQLMNEGCLGQIPEILDGDAPHAQRGCDAQAWGVTEALRVW